MTIKQKLASFVSAFAIGTVGLSAAAMASPMEIEDIGKIQNAGNLTVAPDGETIAYTVSKYPDLLEGEKDGGAMSQLYVMRPGSEPILYTSSKGRVSRVHFSPDGDKIYFLTRRDGDKTNSLYAISLSGGEAKKVFSHATSIGDYAISSDAESLYFVATEKNKDKSKLKDKGFDAYAYEEDLTSPDNSNIAFLAGTDIGDTSDGVLMLANMRNGRFEQLTPDALQHITDIEWLDEDSILAVAHRGVETALVSYDLTGEEEVTYSTPDDIAVRNAEVAQGGKIFFTADSPNHPQEVFATRQAGVEKLTHINSWLDDITLAPQTTFTYEARDGREIEGLLITPKGKKPAGGWPLILTVHGGPEAHYSDGWMTAYSLAGQFGAGDGYAVFYPNYRGSTGRGVDFTKEHQNDYAGAEFNDLVDGVDALADAGIVNEDRVGITGGSYGGYASMWGATAQTEHFAASVAFVGISNQISKFGTSDIPNEMHLVHSLKWPWEDNWMNLLERSPIFHAGKSTTPTLIMHGEKDTRVHPSQSMELYRSMKVRTDTPVRLLFYPNEGHGNRKSASRLDYAYRLMRWMDTYLAEDATRDAPMPEFDLNISKKLDWDKKDSDSESKK